MSKFVMSVRRRPSMAETIDERFKHFIAEAKELPAPWGLAPNKTLQLPPVGTGLSTHAKLRGKLGLGVSGDLKFQYRAPANLDDRAASDDAIVAEFDTSKISWAQVANHGFPGYVRAIGAYIGRLYRWDEAPSEWKLKVDVCNATGKDIDGRDGPLRFGPITFMDEQLCRRACNDMTPAEIVRALTGTVPDVRSTGDGVLIVAADHFPEQAEINATDKIIRARLGLPVYAG